MAKEQPIITAETLDETMTLTVTEVCQTLHVDSAFVHELIQYGVLEVTGKPPRDQVVAVSALPRLRQAVTLWHDFELDPAALSLVLDLLDEVKSLRHALAMHELICQTNQEEHHEF